MSSAPQASPQIGESQNDATHQTCGGCTRCVPGGALDPRAARLGPAPRLAYASPGPRSSERGRETGVGTHRGPGRPRARSCWLALYRASRNQAQAVCRAERISAGANILLLNFVSMQSIASVIRYNLQDRITHRIYMVCRAQNEAIDLHATWVLATYRAQGSPQTARARRNTGEARVPCQRPILAINICARESIAS